MPGYTLFSSGVEHDAGAMFAESGCITVPQRFGISVLPPAAFGSGGLKDEERRKRTQDRLYEPLELSHTAWTRFEHVGWRCCKPLQFTLCKKCAVETLGRSGPHSPCLKALCTTSVLFFGSPTLDGNLSICVPDLTPPFSFLAWSMWARLAMQTLVCVWC